MSIPLFGQDYLESPTAGGAIGSKAAELFAQQGRDLAKRIDTLATKAEAQAKAPAIAAAYSGGLTKILSGDFSGFELIGKARAESIGNPLLAAMSEDATKEAVRMSSEYLGRETQKLRLQQDQSQFDQTFKATQDWRQTQHQTREEDKEEQRLYGADKQAESEYNDKVSQIQKINAQREQQNAEGQQANETRKQMGQPEQPFNPLPLIPLPSKPQFKSRAYGGASPSVGSQEGLPSPGGSTLDLGNTDAAVGTVQAADQGGVNPTGRPESRVQQTGSLFSPGEEPAMLPEDRVDPSQLATSSEPQVQTNGAAKTVPKSEPLVNEKPEGKVEQQVGRLVFELPEKKQPSGVKRSVTIKQGSVSETITQDDKSKPEPQEELRQNLEKIGGEPTLSNWVSESILTKKKIMVDEIKDNKGKVVGYRPYRVGADGIHEPYQHKSMTQAKDTKTGAPLTKEDGSPLMVEEGVAKDVPEDLGLSLRRTMELMNGPMKGKFKFKMGLSEQAGKAALATALEDALVNGVDLEEINKDLGMIHGMKTLTQEDLRAFKIARGSSGTPLLKKDVEAKIPSWIPKDVADTILGKIKKKKTSQVSTSGVDVSQFLYSGGGL